MDRIASADTAEDTAADYPCAGGLIAGTLALMTTWAAPEEHALPAHRDLIARKVVSNLFFLRHHPDLAEPMRRVIGKVHERWLPLAVPRCDPAATPLH
jgi:hypothetical protein